MKQHPLCTDTEHGANVLDLPIPAGLKQEWAALQTRRHFLGRTGKVLGWAAHGEPAGRPRAERAMRMRRVHRAPSGMQVGQRRI